MILLTKPVEIPELKKMSEKMFDNIVKAVVDIQKKLMVIDAELHSDQEMMLLQNGSRQEDLWGINLLPMYEKDNPDFVEFDSMINLRPGQGNRSRFVEDPEIRRIIYSIVKQWIA